MVVSPAPEHHYPRILILEGIRGSQRPCIRLSVHPCLLFSRWQPAPEGLSAGRVVSVTYAPTPEVGFMAASIFNTWVWHPSLLSQDGSRLATLVAGKGFRPLLLSPRLQLIRAKGQFRVWMLNKAVKQREQLGARIRVPGQGWRYGGQDLGEAQARNGIQGQECKRMESGCQSK